MNIINIKNEYLTGYYLMEKFQNESAETGLVFIQDETRETKERIELHYTDATDLENKLSYILMILTDK